MKYLLVLSVLLLTQGSNAQDAEEPAAERCHRLEGKRLPYCTPQAKPLECGEPKPCPPCKAWKSCGTMVVTEKKAGTCTTWGNPTCRQEGDRTVCGDAPCLDSSPPTCSEKNVSCGYEATSYPSTGTYSCTEQECNCPSPPAGLVSCGTKLPCQGNQSC